MSEFCQNDPILDFGVEIDSRRANVAVVVTELMECFNSVNELSDHEIDSILRNGSWTGQY